MADDIRRLLNAAAVEPPYILVGHSIAGLHLRVFARLYPSDIAGMVLLDIAHSPHGVMPTDAELQALVDELFA